MMKHYRYGLAVLLAIMSYALVAQAGEAVPLAEDEAVEKRLITISEEMRCLVCQNESLAGSQSDLANDFRREIRSKIKEGQSDKEIRQFLVDRYGDFISYRPPLRLGTMPLWFGPPILFVIGLILLAIYLRRRNAAIKDTLSDADRARAEALLRGDDPK